MKTILSFRWLWVIVALQAVFLLTWAGYHETVRHMAPTIRLKTMPVDPRDLLRGDYMTLNYEISRHRSTSPEGRNRDEVCVVLKPAGNYQAIDEILTHDPLPEDERLWVYATASGRDGDLRLEYGIERYFVPEGRGTPSFKNIEVEASVSPTHRLYIKHVRLDGKLFP